MQIEGTLKLIGPIQQISATFSKREFVIVTNEQYPQSIQLELHGSNVDIIDPYGVGEQVKVLINLRGKLWINPNGEERYFNSILAWRIERVAANTNSQEYAPPSPPEPNYGPPADFKEEDLDDLPF